MKWSIDRHKRIWMCLSLCLCLLSAISAAAESAYVETIKCKMCHPNQYNTWGKTGMASALESLRPGQAKEEKVRVGLDPNKDYSTDPSCLGCHTTGYGEKGGFTDEKNTPAMAGIQCEACHGAGEGYMPIMMKNPRYKLSDVMAKGLISPKETCVKCHNEKNPFHKPMDIEERIKKGVHEHKKLKFPH